MTRIKNPTLVAFSVVVAVAIGMTMIQVTSANQTDNNFAGFKSDIRDLVRSGDCTWEEAVEVRKLHDKELDQRLVESEIRTNITLSGVEREQAKNYILNEELKRQIMLLNDEHIVDATSGNEIETTREFVRNPLKIQQSENAYTGALAGVFCMD